MSASISLAQGAQPLGLLPLPLGLLVLPPVAAEGGALARMLAGDAGGPWPPEWEFWGAAAQGDGAGALALLAGLADPLGAYDRFVLAPEPAALEALLAQSEGDLRLLVQAAAYVHGLLDETPAPASAAAPEVAGLLALPAAAAAVEVGDVAGAVECLAAAALEVAAVSPILAAQLEAQAADLERGGSPARAAARVKRALGWARGSRLEAGLWLQLGLYLHEDGGASREGLNAAVQAYQAAVRAGLSRDSNPEAFALVQNNLGLAYLSMPMTEAGDALRMAVAVQSFREALTVYGPDSHPEQWTSVQLNLANALQYLPSSHPEENLIQAVEIYDQLLARRPKSHDPLGYARLLANQGNALAHLGMFGPALTQLDEAHKLLHWHGEPELAASVLAQVAVVHDQMAAVGASAKLEVSP